MRLRKITVTSLILVLIFVLIIGMQALAVDISPMYVNTADINVSLSFSGTTANCSTTITGLSGTTKISASMTLERKNTNGTYTLMKSWPAESVNSSMLSTSKTYSVTSGYTYRLSVNGSVTRNSTTESVSLSAEKYCG